MSGVLRVVLLGAESTGKSTLAAELARTYETLWNPEYGRPYTEIGRDPSTPWTSDEFTAIARVQVWYEDFLAPFARRVLFCDTDPFTTAVFHEAYLGAPTDAFDDLLARPYDLTVVCGVDVPFAQDAIREFHERRQSLHERYLARARSCPWPWVLAEGSVPERVRLVAAALDPLLAAR